MRRLNFLSIEYFLKVAETLNFTVAARELYISQPALSKQIKKFEEQLGIQLFERDTKQVTLTESGQVIYEEFSKIVQNSEKAIGKALALQEKTKSTIRVGILEFDGVISDIAPLLEGYSDLDSNTEVIYEVHGFNSLRRMLDNDEVDLVFSLNTEVSLENRNIYVEEIEAMQLCIVIPPKNPLFEKETVIFDDLAGQTIYIFSDNYSEAGRRSIMAHFDKKGIAVGKIKEFPNIRSMEMALKNGDGITIGYEKFFENNDQFRYVPIADELGHHGLVAAWKVENESRVHDLLMFFTEEHNENK